MRLTWLILLAAMLMPSLCFAWGGEGHQLVALIAEDELTPTARKAIDKQLDGARISDAEVASWSDQIRREQRDTALWHYVDIPVTAQDFDRKRDGRDGNNVIDALEAQTKIFADKSQPKEKRAEALKWVVHLVGDLHQPLHCAERDKDNGGNTRLVFYPGKRQAVNLHQVWDTWLVRGIVGKRRIADVGDALAASITKQQRKDWCRGTPEVWANESHQAAVETAYRDVPADGPPPTLSKRYIDRAQPVVAEQLERGGVRLALVLNKALS
jgi:hypothetical protein